MKTYSFSAEAAKQYGIDGAVLLQGMAYWIEKNAANRRHLHDGRWWTYNSAEALTELFPFWTRRQIQRITGQLTEAGALLIGNFSEGANHNVNWYALSDDALRLVGASEGCLSGTDATTAPNGAVSENAETTAPNGAVYRTKRCSHNRNQNNTTNTPYNPPSGGERETAKNDRIIVEFNRLCGAWPRKETEEERRSALEAYLRERQKGADAECLWDAVKLWAEAGAGEWFALFRVLDGRTWPEEPFFWLFWQAYPRKIDKDKARRAWQKLRPDNLLARQMLQSLKRWKVCDQWQDERYIPHPSVWLNNRRWEAEPPKGGGSQPEPPPEPNMEEWK